MTRSMVVSGAATFPGIHFLYEFRSEFQKIFPLVCGKDETEAGQRLGEAWALAVAAHEDRTAQPAPSLDAIAYDPKRPRCGLSGQTVERILGEKAGRFEHWHFCGNGDAVNIEHLLDLARELGVSRFVLVSAVETRGGQAGSTDTAAPDPDRCDDEWENAPIRAEQALAAFGSAHRIDFRVLRTSLSMGPSATQKQEGCDNPFTDFVAALYEMRDDLRALGRPITLPGDPAANLNLMPVDHLMRDIRQLMTEDFPAGPSYHLTANVAVSAHFALDHLCKTLRFPEIVLSPDAVAEKNGLAARIQERAPAFFRLLAAPKDDPRSLAGRRGVTRYDFFGITHELVRRASGEDNRSLFTGRAVPANGVALNLYSCSGAGKPAVLLINAIGMPVDFWSRLVRSLRDRYSFYTWESRGVPSRFIDNPDGPLALDDHLADCLEVMRRFDLRQAHVVGWCSGAQVATKFAADYPERVRKLVLLNGTYNLKDSASISPFMEVLGLTMAKLGRDRKYAQMYYRMNYGARLEKLPDDEPGSLELEYDPALFHLTSFPFKDPETLFQYARLVNGVLSRHSEEWLGKIDRPTLVISGLADQTAGPEASRRIAGEIKAPHSLVELEKGDHYTLCYHDRVPQLIDAFLEGEGQEPPVQAL